jgi:DegV family protein with EDD domain
MATLLVTDSSACLDPRVARALGVRTVPIGIVFGDGSDDRDDTVPLRRVERALARGEAIKSVAPSVLDYLVAIDAGPGDGAAEVADADSPVVVLTPAAEFTVMYATARRAAALAGRRVEVVDTRTAASAQGLVVAAAGRAAAAGADVDAVVAAAADAAGRVRLLAALGGLETVAERGLVPGPSLDAARQAGPRPLFSFRDGGIDVVGEATGDVVDALLERWRAAGGPLGSDTTVFHAGAISDARRLRQALPAPVPQRFSPAMTLHTGLGLVGVAWMAAPAT